MDDNKKRMKYDFGYSQIQENQNNLVLVGTIVVAAVFMVVSYNRALYTLLNFQATHSIIFLILSFIVGFLGIAYLLFMAFQKKKYLLFGIALGLSIGIIIFLIFIVLEYREWNRLYLIYREIPHDVDHYYAVEDAYDNVKAEELRISTCSFIALFLLLADVSGIAFFFGKKED